MAGRIVVRSLPEAYIQVNCVKRVGKALKGMGVSHAFVITDAGLVKAGIADKVVKAIEKASLPVTLFDGVVPNPTVEVVHAGAKKLQELAVSGALVGQVQRVCLWCRVVLLHCRADSAGVCELLR